MDTLNKTQGSPAHRNRTAARLALVAALFVLITVLRWLYADCLVAEYTPNSPHDSTLQFVKSISFAQGEWMGPYQNLTLIKGCFYPIFAGTAFALSLPYVAVLQAAYLLACLFCTWAFFPLLKNRFAALGFYALLLFNPISTSAATRMTYRSSLYYILVLFFVSGLCGAALRVSRPGKGKAAFLAAGSLFFGLAGNTREDSQAIALFFGVFLVVWALFLLKLDGRRAAGRIALSLLLSLTLAALPSFLIALKNQQEYGVFLTDDYAAGSFADAYAALQRPVSEQQPDRAHFPIPQDVREKVYAVSETFAELKPHLEGSGGAAVWKGYGSGEDYPNGWVTYALRDAAALAGHYETAQQAQEFWAAVAREVNAACDSGELEAAGKSGLGLAAPLRSAPMPQILRRTLSAVQCAARFGYVTPLLEYVEQDLAYIQSIEQILGCKINASYRNEHGLLCADVDLNGGGHRLIVAVNAVFSRVFALLFPQGIAGFVAAAAMLLRRGQPQPQELAALIVVLGLLLLLVTRCFMMAYMDVTAYATVSRPQYMADSFVIAQLFTLVSLVFAGSVWRRTKKAAKDAAGAPREGENARP